MDINDILNSIRTELRDESQETRIRSLYGRTHAAFLTDGPKGIERELESDWKQLKAKFDKAVERLKKDTGLY